MLDESYEINSPDDLNVEMVKHYMRIEHNLDDFELSLYLKSALNYVRKYVDMYDSSSQVQQDMDIELVIPVLMLVAHFYENKTPINLNNAKVDNIFSDILWMHGGLDLGE